MRVVIAVNQLPPDEIGGVGLFTTHLAQVLVMAGCEVTLLSGAEQRVDGSTRVEPGPEPVPGVRALRLLRSRGSGQERFMATLVNPTVDALLQRTINELAPDVLHVQHTLQLSPRLTTIGRTAGAAVVASVHDYWPICQRITLRLPGGRQCDGPAGGLRCAACLPPDQWRSVLGQALGAPLRGARRGALFSMRLLPYMLRTQIVQGCYARAHRITCPAPSVARMLHSAGFPSERVVVLDYGIPTLPPGVDNLPRPRDPLRVGYLGTLGPHKGVELALDALHRRPEASWRLLVYGGPLRDEALRRQLEQAERAGQAEYRGPYTEHQLPGILADLDAVVIPSLWRETGPMVCMEAQSAGLPVVASKLGALAERVNHEQDGLLVPAGDADALADALDLLVRDYDHLRRGAQGRKVRTVQDAASELLTVYLEALEAAKQRN